ncbi:MAG: S8 family serine peptidase [Desulfitobacteriaceae bacterium]
MSSLLRFTNVISIAAINNNGNLWSLSNYGNKVNVAAPGESIISILPNNQYAFEDGTSMATPFVTGVAALLKSKSSELTPNQIKNIIISNVKKISGLTNYVSSGGIVNAYSSLMKIY